jgi:tetratricopeptide (TPR) repeat protein
MGNTENDMRTALIAAFLIALPAPLTFAAGSGGGSGNYETMSPSRSMTPQEQARSQYKTGLKHKEKAWKLEEKAAKATKENDKTKNLANAQKEYNAAIKNYLAAIKLDQKQYEAMNELGYAYRKTGDYQNAVRAYNTALMMKPDFHEAIEYRGEAYLALNLFDKTKEAYLTLFRDAPELASKLMQAMEDWAAKQPADASGEAAAFNSWVQERKALVSQTQSLSMSNAHRW